ncbi:lissencephaly-1 homolog A-like [Penaeus monodon]|uniref:lissencephaly-1 homolog A-like n=1 Tax=Penaeus monodon TaxID=6687 RepID=UPI0018A77B65|nr:lissencephaly-1 homolog A-like [Penaeus monodon]
MEESKTVEYKNIRKLRKKLRQIEYLELLNRELNEEEIIKVNSKDNIRAELQRLLKEYFPDEVDIMKRTRGEFSNEPQEKKSRNGEEDVEFCDVSPPSLETAKEENQDKPAVPSQIQVAEVVSALKPQKTSRATQALAVGETTSKQDVPQEKMPQPTKGKPAEPTKPKKEPCIWRDTNYKVYTLKGHNDIILDVDCSDGYVLSASRDTTVRVWRVGGIEEERSLRGHRASVTSVAFLPGELAAAVLAKLEAEYDEIPSVQGQQSPECRVLAVSGGLDCTMKVWDVISGESHGSIYTYNGITCLSCGTWGIVTGTEGGKLEIWCVSSGQRFAFVNAFESQVISVVVIGNVIYAGSFDGEIGIWKYDSKKRTLGTQYLLEPESPTQVKLKQLSCLAAHGDCVYLGDSGPNIKKFNWKKSSATRLKNHVGDAGMTDSLTITPEGHLLSASYYMDVGYPSINVRSIEKDEYICSLISQGEGRYLTMCTAQGVIVTGGHELKVWVSGASGKTPRKNAGIETVRPSFLRKLSGPAQETSDEDTDFASTTDDDDDDMQVRAGANSSMLSESNDSSSWWCTVV